MSSSSEVAETAVKNRFLGFLIWESISSATTFLLFKTLNPFLSPSQNFSLPSLFLSLLYFLTFLLSNLFFSSSLHAISSPQPLLYASPSHLLLALLRSLFFVSSSSSSDSLSSQSFRRRANVSLLFLSFLVASTVAGFFCLVSLTENPGASRVAIRGFVSGFVYSLAYIYKRRWLLDFPVIQRPLFFRFKMGISAAVLKAFKLTNAAYLFSSAVLPFVPYHSDDRLTLKKFVVEQIGLYIGTFVVFLCWELSHLLYQVLHTKRFIFAPPIGSAVAETNPSEPLLAALEESSQGSLVQYLAYLDLCIICENNVDTWRRAAFFEETGETYKRVVAVCLRPLEQLCTNLLDGWEGSSGDKSGQISNQLLSPSEFRPASNAEPLNNFQQCAWSARAIASLTACSHKVDRFGVAQLSGGNAAVISTLVSCLLAVEAFMGRKTNLQSGPNQFMGPAGIKWATPNTGGREVVAAKKRSGPVHPKAYAMADILRTSIYCIVNAFHGEMLAGAKAGLLEKDWVVSGKPFFGTRELLLQKLHLFLDFRAN